MKGENWWEMAISLSLKWLWAGWEEGMASWNLNFVLQICLSLWVKAPKYKSVGTAVSAMVWCGCTLIIRTFNPLHLFFFSLLCFLSFLFWKCQGLVRWPSFCGFLGHAEPQVSMGRTLLLKRLTWCIRGEAGFTAVCRTCLLLPAHSNFLPCLLNEIVRTEKHLWVVHQREKGKKNHGVETLPKVWALYMLRDATVWFVWELKCGEISLLLSWKV